VSVFRLLRVGIVAWRRLTSSNMHSRFASFLAALGLVVSALVLSPASAQPASASPTDPAVDNAVQLAPAAKGDRPNRMRAGGNSRRSQRVVPFEAVRVASPDGNVVFTLLSNAERLTYLVTLGGQVVIEPSALKFDVDGFDLASGVAFKKAARSEINETYPWHGTHSTATNHCQVAVVDFTHDLSLTSYSLEIRVFNDGIGYRFIVPGEPGVTRTPDEFSSFILPTGTVVWFEGVDGHYEGEYKRQAIEEVSAGEWSAPPLTFELPAKAGFGFITEANLVNYSGMALEADGRRGWTVGLGHREPLSYPYELRYGRENGKRLGKPAAVTGTITTPWRVVVVGRDLNALVNSDVLPNLCPPADPKLFPQGMNTPWVAPGTAVWRYTDGGENSYEGIKKFSELGGKIGARYQIVEGIWSRWTDEQIKEIVDYSRQQGVGLLFWRHSNQLRTPEARTAFFERLHRLGLAGAKIDFFDHEAKENVDLYQELLRLAAENQMVIDFHGANKPTGLLRTFPNEMIREAVRGMESSRLPDRARHELVLPFTRYLAGPCDYTTMHFGARRGNTTWAHQIACLATFQSPMLTIAANPEAILNHPAADVIKGIPAVWDETIVLPDSRIGALSIFARRRGTEWFLAVMRAGAAQTIKVPLTFLQEGTRYRTTLVRDDADKDDAVKLEQGTAGRSDVLEIQLRAGGGFVGRFSAP
jgi:alpha-glucosidase